MSGSAVWAKCRECSHVWPAVPVPIDLSVAAMQLRNAICPACHNDSPVLARKADIESVGARISASGIPITRITK